MKLLENTEEIRIDKFELIGEKLEFQILPGMAMTASLGAKQMIKGLAAFARALETEIIAEGVETEVQVSALKGLSIDMAKTAEW